MSVNLTMLNYLVCLSKSNPNELMHLLKENNLLAEHKKTEVRMKIKREETTIFGVHSILDLKNERRWPMAEMSYLEK